MFIKNIKEFVKEFTYLDEFLEVIDINSLDEVNGNDHLELFKKDLIIKNYINGDELRESTFVFLGRDDIHDDLSKDIKFIRLHEKFDNWINNQSSSGTLPKLYDGFIPRSIKVISPNYISKSNTSKGRYQILLQLIYYKSN